MILIKRKETPKLAGQASWTFPFTRTLSIKYLSAETHCEHHFLWALLLVNSVNIKVTFLTGLLETSGVYFTPLYFISVKIASNILSMFFEH